ncbi:MAG: Phosphatidate cytidylyltransferase [Pseudolabrys sp.]|jgi:phosphatidate cytidylyltransferase|nr:Phosphatidate cytidylyltransferase [Pseudolabrys sp.]
MPGKAHGLMARLLSAAILAPLAIVTTYFGGWPFAIFWSIAAVVTAWEWMRLVAAATATATAIAGIAAALCALLTLNGRLLFALGVAAAGALGAAMAVSPNRRRWVAAGAVYAALMALGPLLIRGQSSFGMVAIFLLFAVVWTTDILGYFAGRTFGGPKLAPSISPAKTWSGAVAGVIGAAIVVGLGAFLTSTANVIMLVIVAIVLSIAGQLGDLLESALKRRFGAKDASQLIPGHGGVMDRLDGFWAATLCAVVIGLAHGGFGAVAQGLLVW